MKKNMETSESHSIRFPDSLWDALYEAAKKNDRTIASEVIFRLRKSFKNT